MSLATPPRSLPRRSREPLPPKEVGRKFDADGRVRAFAGNTVIAHLPQAGPGFRAFDRLLDIYRDLPRLRFARKVSALPSSSYHMTIFSGPTDLDRRPGVWPAGLALDAPMAVCDAFVLERLSRLRLGDPQPLRMTIDEGPFAHEASPITIDLKPATAADGAQLHRIREAISEALGCRAPDHDAYRFHVTIAYQIAPFTASEQEEYFEALTGWRRGMAADGIVFELGPPEVCTFRDMFAFDTKLVLDT